jgi:glyoxylase-like metal-dependent hydrolase (beta-lactamase superfamily II)
MASGRKALKWLGIALGVLVLLAAVGAGWVWSQTGPGRIEVGPGVVGVRAGYSYAWVLKTPHGAALVDAGVDPSGKALLDELKAQGLTPNDVHTVLITHGHPDHYAAAALFKNARVLTGPGGDAAYVRGERSSTSPAARLFGAVLSPPPSPARVEELPGDMRLEVDGLVVQAIHVPGHTPGSMVYVLGDVVFVGDSLRAEGDGVDVSPWFFSEDKEKNRASMAKLSEVAFARMADGHSGLTLDAKAKLMKADFIAKK